MPTTSLGLRYPTSTGNVRPYEDIQNLAQDVNAILVGRTPVQANSALTALVTLPGSPTDLVGTSITVNLTTANAVYLAAWTMAGQLMSNGNVTGIVTLMVDGATASPQAIWNPANVVAASGSPRGGQGQQVSGILSGAGNHTFKLQGSISRPTGTTGDIRLDNLHTCLSVLVLPY